MFVVWFGKMVMFGFSLIELFLFYRDIIVIFILENFFKGVFVVLYLFCSKCVVGRFWDV